MPLNQGLAARMRRLRLRLCVLLQADCWAMNIHLPRPLPASAARGRGHNNVENVQGKTPKCGAQSPFPYCASTPAKGRSAAEAMASPFSLSWVRLGARPCAGETGSRRCFTLETCQPSSCPPTLSFAQGAAADALLVQGAPAPSSEEAEHALPAEVRCTWDVGCFPVWCVKPGLLSAAPQRSLPAAPYTPPLLSTRPALPPRGCLRAARRAAPL